MIKWSASSGLAIPFPMKMIISIIWDAFDMALSVFFIIPVLGSSAGTMWDTIGTGVATIIWGGIGLVYAWEVIDITNIPDGLIPTMTMIGAVQAFRGGMLK